MSNTSLLPPNSTDFERNLETVVETALNFDIVIDTLWSPEKSPEALLPVLAWALSVDYWDDHAPEDVRRALISQSVFLHRHKGTAAAVKRAVEALDLGIQIAEWFEYGGDPYHFRADIDVTRTGIDGQTLRAIFQAIETSKNIRSVLEALRVFITTPAQKVKTMTLAMGTVMTIGPYIPSLPPQDAKRGLAMGLHTISHLEIGAYRE